MEGPKKKGRDQLDIIWLFRAVHWGDRHVFECSRCIRFASGFICMRGAVKKSIRSSGIPFSI